MFIKLKAGEPLNRSNYRLFADIFVNIIAAVLLLQRLQHFLLIVCFHTMVQYYVHRFILLEHRYL